MLIPIFTIGHGSRTIEQFIDLIRRNQIDYVIDVRSQPYSKYNPAFSKEELEKRLWSEQIQYVFMGDQLGGRPNLPSCYTNGKVDYEKLREKDFYRQGIARLHKAWEQQLRVAIMCSEGKPQECHRSKLIGESLVKEGIEVVHIDEKGVLVSQEEVIARFYDGQLSLFGPEERSFQSRKRYLKDSNETPEGEGDHD